MEESLININKQLNFKIRESGNYLICGMGGSHLSADILKMVTSSNIQIYSDYGLPKIEDNTLIILSSFSGNTEEILDNAEHLRHKKEKNNIIVITSGGKLLEIAKELNWKYYLLPTPEEVGFNLQPRYAMFYSLKILSYIIDTDIYCELETLSWNINSQYISVSKKDGLETAKKIGNKIPIIYSSNYLSPLAYNLKIKFNENSKIPAFTNVFPELNHNEINGFNPGDNFFFIFLTCDKDNDRIKKRISITKNLLVERKFLMTELDINNLSDIVYTLYDFDWITYYIALEKNISPDEIKIIDQLKEELKK